MTRLSPLLQASSDDVELALLRSTERDEPTARAMARTAVALGLGASVATVAFQAAAAAKTSSSVLASAGSTTIWISTLKALVIGAISGAVVSTGAHAVFSESSVDQQADVGRVAPPQNTMVSNPPSPTLQLAEPPSHGETRDEKSNVLNSGRAHSAFPSSPLVTPASRAGAAPPRVPTTVGSNPSSPSLSFLEPPVVSAAYPAPSSAIHAINAGPASGSSAREPARSPPNAVSIADEVRSIESARQALSNGRARDALTELQRYQARWPSGVFSAEALVLRVQARIQLGDRASALREANALIAAQPNSRHASRLRELVGIPSAK